MATRRLARTVVEGGRNRHSKIDRWLNNRALRRLRFDQEGEVIPVVPRLDRCGWQFDDRLAPLRRWLDRHVGRGWSHVHRDLCALVDRRTTKGWHLVDHLHQMVDRGEHHHPSPRGFFVDEGGILRRYSRSRRNREAASVRRRQRNGSR